MNRQPRILLIVLWILTFVMISGSYYFQWIEHLEPCLLCIMQRFCVLALFGILSASLILTTLRWQIFLAFLESLVALCGLYFAMRQIWLQALPQDQLPACLPGFDTLIHYFPWQMVIKALFLGTAQCGEVTWRGFGLSMPAWCGFYFFGMVIHALFQGYKIYDKRALI